MKYLWIGIAILAVLLVVCISVNEMLTEATEAVQSELQIAAQYGAEKDFTLAAAHAKKAADEWDTHLRFFASVLCHDETDEITAGLAELQVVEDAEFLQTVSTLLARLSHIAEMDRPLLHNIL